MKSVIVVLLAFLLVGCSPIKKYNYDYSYSYTAEDGDGLIVHCRNTIDMVILRFYTGGVCHSDCEKQHDMFSCIETSGRYRGIRYKIPGANGFCDDCLQGP